MQATSHELLQVPRNVSEIRCAIAARSRPSHLDRDHDAVARVLERGELVVDPRDRSVARWLLEVGFWEWEITRAIADCVRPDSICVDLGANAGYFSAAFFLLGARKVVAVEAHPDLARRLRLSGERNGWRDFEVVNCAVSDQPGAMRLWVHGDDNLGGSPVVAADFDQPGCIDVQARTLDDVLGDLAPIQVLKIDCEGSEPRIWRGMQRVLANNPDVHIFAEVAVNDSTPAWLREVEAAGFPLRCVDNAGGFAPLRIDRLHEQDLWMGYFHRD